jgi:hypothetical protein
MNRPRDRARVLPLERPAQFWIRSPYSVVPVAWLEPRDGWAMLEDAERHRVGAREPESDPEVQRERAARSRTAPMTTVAITYRVLAAELHPDRGGSHEAMARLNHVRTLLRKAV